MFSALAFLVICPCQYESVLKKKKKVYCFRLASWLWGLYRRREDWKFKVKLSKLTSWKIDGGWRADRSGEGAAGVVGWKGSSWFCCDVGTCSIPTSTLRLGHWDAPGKHSSSLLLILSSSVWKWKLRQFTEAGVNGEKENPFPSLSPTPGVFLALWLWSLN